ncbi:hypothetical protein ED733_000127 [Metarhizium rileyi]|uniref:Major facilitator superfamily (MFS) profile domain-containing protein n=1 Tax=Metarhizium rileyi (strain RCEF 4871) TaxID=1649241 RepID=A0A5C6G1Y6_METRR|nr:hypothetical protein ED733_000127 [Metarhizium rileyi]
MNKSDKTKRFIYHVFRPRKYIVAALYLSIGGFLNGYDTGSIGSITDMPRFQSTVQKLSPTIRGLTVSFLLLAGTIPSLVSGLLADRFGHLRIVLSGALFFTLGCAMQAGANSLLLLLLGRALAGMGEGLYLGNLNVYICEIAPKARRGMMVAMPQLMVTLGTCLGYFTCYGTIRIAGDMQWRLPFIVQAAGGLLFAVGCLILPKSPRWLMSQNKQAEALHNMKLLDFEPNEINHDLNHL